MNETEVIHLGNSLLKEHNLEDWIIDISKTQSCIGQCFYHEKTIKFSKFFLDNSEEKIKNIILHEIAHALVGPQHGHNRVFKNKCYEIGTEASSRTTTLKSDKIINYEVYCSNNCFKPLQRNRMPTKLIGRKCCKCNKVVNWKRK